MAIRFTCTCGKSLEVDAILAGHDVRCPACNATVRAPKTSSGPSHMDETPMEHIKARIAEGLQRDQLSTKVIVVAGSWFGLLLIAMFFAVSWLQYSNFFMWLFIWVPLIASLELAAYLTLTANRWGKPLLVILSLVSIGISWTYLWLGISSFAGEFPSPTSAAVAFMCSFVNLLICVGLIWYFGRNYLALILPPDESAPSSPSQPQALPKDGNSP